MVRLGALMLIAGVALAACASNPPSATNAQNITPQDAGRDSAATTPTTAATQFPITDAGTTFPPVDAGDASIPPYPTSGMGIADGGTATDAGGTTDAGARDCRVQQGISDFWSLLCQTFGGDSCRSAQDAQRLLTACRAGQ